VIVIIRITENPVFVIIPAMDIRTVRVMRRGIILLALVTILATARQPPVVAIILVTDILLVRLVLATLPAIYITMQPLWSHG
jgi:hypothetical protein